MVELYCRDHHGTRGVCDSCAELLTYSDRRLDLCPYGSDKPTCANCPIHCYKAGPRARARMIMRYSGPRMLFRHPYLAISHKIDGFIAARHPKELTRDERAQMKGR